VETQVEVKPFSYTLGNAGSLKQAVGVLAALLSDDEAHLVLDEGGISVAAMDGARIAMIRARARGSQFESINIEGPTSVCLDFYRLDKALALVEKDERVELSYADKQFVVRTDRKRLTVPTFDVPYQAIPVLNGIRWDAEATVYAGDFAAAVKRAAKLNDHVQVRRDQDGVEVHSENDHDGTYTETIEDQISGQGEARSAFIAQYLLLAANKVPRDVPVRIDLGNDLPIHLGYTLPDPDIEIEVWIAPRVDD